MESKTPSISGLAATSALTAVENKIPNVSSLVEKQIIMQKLVALKRKSLIIIMTNTLIFQNLISLHAEIFAARLARAVLITKTDFVTKLISLNKNSNSNKTEHLLVENELKNLQTFDSSCFRGKNYFENDATQNYLVFQPMSECFKRILMLVMVNIFIFGNLKDCLMKGLVPLLHLITVLLPH